MFGRAAEDDEPHAPRAQPFQKRPRAVNDKLLWLSLLAQNFFAPLGYRCIEAAMVLQQQLLGDELRSAALANALGVADHLMYRRSPVKRKNLFHQALAERGFGLPRLRLNVFPKKPPHDLRPAMSKPGERAVKIEQCAANLTTRRKTGAELDQPAEPSRRKHLLASKILFG